VVALLMSLLTLKGDNFDVKATSSDAHLGAVAEPRNGQLVQLHPLKVLNLYQYFFFYSF